MSVGSRAPWPSVEDERAEERWQRNRLIVRRSVLIVPVNVPRFVEKAHLRGADAVMLDLEDSIPEPEKDAARGHLAAAVAQVGRGGADVLVRINKPFARAAGDVDAVVAAGGRSISFPKAESAAEIVALDALLSQCEARAGLEAGSIELSVAVETARGLLRAPEIAAASERIVGIDVGAEDFARDLETAPTVGGDEVRWAKEYLAVVARATGVPASGMMGSLADYTDLAAFERSARAARALGYRGAACIHPTQVPILNAAFSPSRDEVDEAREVVAAFDEAASAGRGSVAVRGRMVDIPVVERARLVLERAATIAAVEERQRVALARLGATPG